MLNVALTIIIVLAATPASAQIRDSQKSDVPELDSQQQPILPSVSIQTDRLANGGIGQVGQRQTRGEAAPNIEPIGRIQSRIANRVQSRIRNRIDRSYDPQANTNSPFKVAEDQSRAGSR